MGILDKVKGLFKGREEQIKGGIDKVSDTIEKKVPGQAQRIDDMSDKAKDAVDNLAGNEPDAAAPTTSTAPAPKPTPPVTPSTTTPPVTPPTTPPAP
ncbi:MAG: antitoxin [Ilumatobacteraceae bacterium]